MCGRYVAATPSAVLADFFAVADIADGPGADAPSFNVAPTDPVPAVVTRHERRRLGRLRWGLMPSWAKDSSGAARLINARAETLATKPAFRSAFARRRCLLPADGFYEWGRGDGKTRQPWFFRRADGAPMAFAGLWEVWRDPSAPDSDLIRTCAVVTSEANSLMAPIHDRMPVALEPGHWEMWLDPSVTEPERLAPLLGPGDPRLLECWAVSSRVNSVRNNDPDLLIPAGQIGDSPSSVAGNGRDSHDVAVEGETLFTAEHYRGNA